MLEPEIKAALAAHAQQLEKAMTDYHADIEKKSGQASTALTAKIDQLSAEYKSLNEKIFDLAQKSTAPTHEKKSRETVGEMLFKSATFESLKNGFNPNGVSRALEVKNTITSDSTTVLPAQIQGVIGGSFAPATVRSLIQEVPISGNALVAIRENGWTNAAAFVAQGASKPASTLTFEDVTLPVQTIAHTLKVSRQLLQDAPAVIQYTYNRLRHGLSIKVDEQLVLGTGTSPDIEGLTKSGNFTAYTPTTGDTLIDAIVRASSQMISSGEYADSIIVNPADWAALTTAKASGDGHYLYGIPGSSMTAAPFGLRLAQSQYVPAGSFIVAGMMNGVSIHGSMAATIDMGYVNDDFQRNLLTLRAEERLALFVARPATVLYGEFTA